MKNLRINLILLFVATLCATRFDIVIADQYTESTEMLQGVSNVSVMQRLPFDPTTCDVAGYLLVYDKDQRTWKWSDRITGCLCICMKEHGNTIFVPVHSSDCVKSSVEEPDSSRKVDGLLKTNPLCHIAFSLSPDEDYQQAIVDWFTAHTISTHKFDVTIDRSNATVEAIKLKL
jgi:hypothetical protein